MQKLLTFFSKNISVFAIFNDQSLNDTITKDTISFEQLGPDVSMAVMVTNRSYVFQMSYTYIRRSCKESIYNRQENTFLQRNDIKQMIFSHNLVYLETKSKGVL